METIYIKIPRDRSESFSFALLLAVHFLCLLKMERKMTMKTPKTDFEEALMQDAGLLHLQKSDMDLFLILQANTITYQQLYMTRIHGNTSSSGRLSLKKLENQGYVTGKTYAAGKKLYHLTVKGKNRLQWLLQNKYLERLSVNFDRRPPASQLQLPHRVYTNDFYFAYVASPYARPCIWVLEKGLMPVSNQDMQPPRCDGCLTTACRSYYIEQDNHTQSDGVLQAKVEQYLKTDLFSAQNISQNVLVFTLSAAGKDRPPKKPPFSVYKVLLKALKLWNNMAPQSKPGTFREFTSLLSGNLGVLLSKADKELLARLAVHYPALSYQDTILLKNSMLEDESYKEAVLEQNDLIFRKRLQQKFYRLAQGNHPAFVSRLQQGMHLYVLPNHRLRTLVPFVLPVESHLPDQLLQCLYYSGCSIDLEYHPLYTLQDRMQTSFVFTNVFCAFGSYIIFEDIAHDLGGRERVLHFLKHHHYDSPLLLVLLVSGQSDAENFLIEIKDLPAGRKPPNLTLCFLDKTLAVYEDPSSVYIYQVIQINGVYMKQPVSIEIDFNGEIQVSERQVQP